MSTRSYFPYLGISTALILGVASGFRWFGPGADYSVYLDFYNDLRLDGVATLSRFEPGYVFAAFVAKFVLQMNFAMFTATLVTAGLLIKFFVFSHLPKPFYVTAFYLFSWYFLHDYTQVRIATATAISLLACLYLFQGKLWKCVIFVCLATLFHITAAFTGLIIFFCWYLRYKSAVASTLLVILVTAAVPYIVLHVLPIQFLLYLNADIQVYLDGTDAVRANLFSGTNILTAVLLAAVAWGGGLQDGNVRIVFLMGVAGLGLAFAFGDFLAISMRLKEALLVFLPLIAISSRLTARTVPQRVAAFSLAGWQMFSLLKNGLLAAVL